MNKLVFKIDNQGKIIYCHYLEHSYDSDGKEVYINEMIDLPSDKLKIFYQEVCLLDGHKKSVFENVNRSLVQKYLDLSNRYKEEFSELISLDENINKIIENLSNKSSSRKKNSNDKENKIIKFEQSNSSSSYNENSISKPKKKIVRKNLFSNKIIGKISPILLATLITLSSIAMISSINYDSLFDSKSTSQKNINTTVKILNVDNTYNDSYHRIYLNFNSFISEYAEKYGISPELLLAVITYNYDTYGINIYEENGNFRLFKIDSNLIGKEVSAYDFSKKREERVFVVDNEYLESHKNELKNKKNVCNIDFCMDNLHVGCMIFQSRLNDERLRGNILMGIMANEVGVDRVLQIVKNSSNLSKINYESLFEQNSLIWLNYRRGYEEKYLEKVLSYIASDTDIYVKRLSGQIDSITYDNGRIQEINTRGK